MALTKAHNRMIADAAVNVKDFGAVGDGVADDTAAIQAAEDQASTNKQTVFFPAGTYLCGNLTKKSYSSWRGEGSRSTIIKASSSISDSTYFIACSKWLEAGATTHNFQFVIEDLQINADGNADYAFVLKSFYCNIERCFIKGATDTDLLISSDAQDGTASAGTMVNGVITNSWLGQDAGTAQFNLKLVDSANAITDWQLINCYLSSATDTNAYLPTSAGWLLSGNHFYTGTKNLFIDKSSIGTRVTNNYFEDTSEFRSGSGGGTFYSVTYGPGNFFKDDVTITHTNNSYTTDTVVMLGNTYADNVQLIHNYNSNSKFIVSKSEVFRDAAPFSFTPSNSVGRFIVNNATIEHNRKLMDLRFIGPTGSDSGWEQLPTNFVESNKIVTTKLGAGTDDPQTALHVYNGDSGFAGTYTGDVTIEDDIGARLQFLTPNTQQASIAFGDNNNGVAGLMTYDHADNSFEIQVNGSTALTIDSSRRVIIDSIPTSDPGVSGALWSDSGTIKISA